MKKLHRRVRAQTALVNGKMTFGDLIHAYEQQLNSRADIKRRTKKYYNEVLDAVTRSTTLLAARDVAAISEKDCRTWANGFRSQYSATRFNAALSLMRGMFVLAIEAGARFDNPALSIARASIRPKQLNLPSREQFLRNVANGVLMPKAIQKEFQAMITRTLFMDDFDAIEQNVDAAAVELLRAKCVGAAQEEFE
jgi:site-specific recombinase XerD